MNGDFAFVADTLDHRPDAGHDHSVRSGIETNRTYGGWLEMLEGETAREDRIDLATVAMPSATHFEITRFFLKAGFHVLFAKPMTIVREDGEEIVKLTRETGPRSVP